MKKILYILTMTVMMIVGCQQNPKLVTVGIEAEKTAIQKVFDEHFTALDSFDLDKLLSLQTEDIIEMPPNMPRIVGKEAYAEFCKPVLDFSRTLKSKEMSNVPTEFVVTGNWAFQIGTYKSKSTLQNDMVIEDEGNYLFLFKKDSIGNWKWARVIYNSTKPLK